jgi:hypothetical protein
MKKGLIITLVVLALAGAATAAVVATQPPPPPNTGGSMTGGNSEMEFTDNMADAIRDVMDALGPAPDNVVGFGMGFKRPQGTVITGEENGVLLQAYRRASGIFASDESNMDCRPTVDAERMLEYDPQSSDNTAAGYGAGNNMFAAKAGYTVYDSLGNLDERIGKTVTWLVSADKTVMKYDSDTAVAAVDRADVYAYWIQSVPDENKLQGTVFNKGTDDRQDDPVKKGVLFFKRIGPSPSATDEQIEVDGGGRYNIAGKLTAGHYEVSFDPLDGKGKKVINSNWLYIPGDWKEVDKDWFVLVRNTYKITYDHVAKMAASNLTANTLHMEWHDIPLDWLTESEEALASATEACFPGMYCITYAYKDANEKNRPPSQENMDESETEMTPGYYPDVFQETPVRGESGEMRLEEVPTLSFYRGTEEGGYIDGNFYVCIPMDISVVLENGFVLDTALLPGYFDPMTEAMEKSYRGMGWEDFAFLGKLELEGAKALIETGTPLEIGYTHENGAFVKLVIEVED